LIPQFLIHCCHFLNRPFQFKKICKDIRSVSKFSQRRFSVNNKSTSDKNQTQWWKIAVCILGVLMIAGAITYTLMTRAAASSAAPVNNSPAPVTGIPGSPASDGVGELNWVKALSSKYATNDFVFIVLPANNDSTGKVDQVIKSASNTMRQDGAAVDTMTLSPTDPEFSATTERLAIQKLPAVLLFASTGQGAIIKGDITETKLLQAYLTIVKTCVPGSSGCCPAK
jgi:hypothetical protein